MKRRNIREDGVLKVMIICFAFGVIGNIAEYFFVNKNNLKHVSGSISWIKIELYDCRGEGRYSMTTCGETVLKLHNNNKAFRIRDYARNEPFLTRLEVGDKVDIYYPKWYQRLMTFGFARGFYRLESDGLYFDNISAWKSKNIGAMILFAIFLVIFSILYVFQRLTIKKLLEGKQV